MVEQQAINKQKGGYKQIEPRWQPGESGNLAGRPKDAVSTLLKRKDNQAVANKLYDLALAGDMKAIDVFLDRTEGKVVDKHLSLIVQATPESIQAAQERLLNAQGDTGRLLERYPKRATE